MFSFSAIYKQPETSGDLVVDLLLVTPVGKLIFQSVEIWPRACSFSLVYIKHMKHVLILRNPHLEKTGQMYSGIMQMVKCSKRNFIHTQFKS